MKWLLGGFVATAAIVAGVSFYKHLPEISYTLDFGSVLDAIALLLIGALVEYAYLKQSSDKRADTELLLAIVDEAKVAFRGLEEMAHNCEASEPLSPPQRRSLTFAERELSNAIHSIEQALRHCRVSLDKIGFDKLKESREELKDSLTDTPYPGPYDTASIVRIRTASRTLRDELTRIAFAINHR